MIKICLPILIMFYGCSTNQTEVSLPIPTSLDKENDIEVAKRISKNGFCNDWVVNNRFPSDTMMLFLLDSASSQSENIITFYENGSIDYWRFNPLPRCGNYLYYLDSNSKWERNSDKTKLILTLSGGVTSMHTFDHKIRYSIDTSQVGRIFLVQDTLFYCESGGGHPEVRLENGKFMVDWD